MRIATPQLGRSCAAKSSWDENDNDAWQISSPRMKKARSLVQPCGLPR
jgi:hypothetical protein